MRELERLRSYISTTLMNGTQYWTLILAVVVFVAVQLAQVATSYDYRQASQQRMIRIHRISGRLETAHSPSWRWESMGMSPAPVELTSSNLFDDVVPGNE